MRSIFRTGAEFAIVASALFFVASAHAAFVADPERGRGDPALVRASSPGHGHYGRAHDHLIGLVRSESGEPIAGAIVVSTEGGRAVSDAKGEFSLSLAHIAGNARAGQSLRVTAISTHQGKTLVGSRAVGGSERSGDPIVITLAAGGSCEPSWLPGFGGQPGVSGGFSTSVSAIAAFDSGNGPILVVAGDFTAAGGSSAAGIARWDGAEWSPLGSGIDGQANALAVFDDGSGGGPALYVGGSFTLAGGVPANNIARWDGSSWSPVGAGTGGPFPTVFSLAVFSSTIGGVPSLYAGGSFTSAGGVAASRIARWNGVSWSPLGAGVNGTVRALTTWNGVAGTAPSLFVGGEFTNAGGLSTSRIARWTGSTWLTVGSGVNSQVLALTGIDGTWAGGGPCLFAGGDFTSAGATAANRVARWSGSTWSALGSGANGSVVSLATYDAGSGRELFMGGAFTTAGGVAVGSLARWNGSAWSAVDVGVSADEFVPQVWSLAIVDVGSGPALALGGKFGQVGQKPALSVASFDGSKLEGLGQGLSGPVHAITTFDDGSGAGEELYVGGKFRAAGTSPIVNLAKWTADGWHDVGGGTNGVVRALTAFDAGSGPSLFVGGGFTVVGSTPASGVARWNGTEWATLGSGVSGGGSGGPSAVKAFARFDDGSGQGEELYAAGNFTVAGGVSANRIAKWSEGGWSALGAGLESVPGFTDAQVNALEVHNDGSGPALFAGGQFANAGGSAANAVARWDGASWAPVPGVSGGYVYALQTTPEGLIVGGLYFAEGTQRFIARWDGSAWTPYGLNSEVGPIYSIEWFDDGVGVGPRLYAGGIFSVAGGASANAIARWNGSTWEPLGSGLAPQGHTMALQAVEIAAFGGPSLIAGGYFGGSPAGDSYVAQWAGCIQGTPCPGDFDRNGTVDGADLATMLGAWGGPGADLDGSGVTDGADLAVLLGAWGLCQ